MRGSPGAPGVNPVRSLLALDRLTCVSHFPPYHTSLTNHPPQLQILAGFNYEAAARQRCLDCGSFHSYKLGERPGAGARANVLQ